MLENEMNDLMFLEITKSTLCILKGKLNDNDDIDFIGSILFEIDEVLENNKDINKLKSLLTELEDKNILTQEFNDEYKDEIYKYYKKIRRFGKLREEDIFKMENEIIIFVKENGKVSYEELEEHISNIFVGVGKEGNTSEEEFYNYRLFSISLGNLSNDILKHEGGTALNTGYYSIDHD